MSVDPWATSPAMRPRHEGANMRTWIGFKHSLYLAEEAVLHWFRNRGYGAQRLYHEYGLAVEIVDVAARFPAPLSIDDELIAEVARSGAGGEFSVTLTVTGPDARRTALRASVVVALVEAFQTGKARSLPEDLAGLVTTDISGPKADEHRLAADSGRPVSEILTAEDHSISYWCWIARYLYCHYSDHVQHSAYIRTLEEAVDRFLAERGLSIGSMLATRGWIPVVSRTRIQLIAEAHMEETIHTTFSIDAAARRFSYPARMDCYVQREGRLVHTATAAITHGYMVAEGEHTFRPVRFDDTVIAALTSRKRQL